MNFFFPYSIRGEERWTYHEKNETTILGWIFGLCEWDERNTQRAIDLKQGDIYHLFLQADRMATLLLLRAIELL